LPALAGAARCAVAADKAYEFLFVLGQPRSAR